MEHQRLTNKEVKKKNRNQIFRYLCAHGTVSNPDIASDLHLSLPTVTNTTRELLESGLLQDLGEMQSTGGRRARALCAASDYRFFPRTGHYPESSGTSSFESYRRYYKI